MNLLLNIFVSSKIKELLLCIASNHYIILYKINIMQYFTKNNLFITYKEFLRRYFLKLSFLERYYIRGAYSPEITLELIKLEQVSTYKKIMHSHTRMTVSYLVTKLEICRPHLKNYKRLRKQVN